MNEKRVVDLSLSKEKLETLLAGRKKEYIVFGRTSEDAIYDMKIFNRIKEIG